MTAVAALPGMPRVSRWIMAPPVEPFTDALGGDEAARVPGAEELRLLRELLLEPVGHERRHGRARAREAAHRDADGGAPRERPAERPEIAQAAAAGSPPPSRSTGTRADAVDAICSSTSPMAKRPISTVTKSTPVLRKGTPKTKRSTPYWASVPMVPRNMPGEERDERRGHRRLAEHGHAGEAEDHHREELDGGEAERDLGEGRREEGQEERADEPAHRRAS